MIKKLNYKSLCFFFCFTLSTSWSTTIAQCGVSPVSGLVTISAANNIVNTYYPGTGNPLAGNISLSVGAVDSRGNKTAIAAGDLVLIIQIQGADVNATNTDAYGDGVSSAPATGYLNTNLNTGYYEYNTVASISGSNVTFSYSLANNYYNREFTAAVAIQRYQVIRIPRYYNFTISAAASITCPSWNGNTGAVVAVDVANTFILDGSIDVSNKGFRGGGGKNLVGATEGNSNGASTLNNTDYRWNSPIINSANLTGGAKGEGIAGTPAYYFNFGTVLTTTGTVEGYINGSMGRGAPANGGGGGTDGAPVGTNQNQYNTGGGGGGNGGNGGNGGSGWHGGTGNVTTYPYGGYGGNSFAQRSIQRFSLGGGGGAGTANNSTTSNEYNCSGGSGGGIVLARVKLYAGTGSVFANGSNAPGVTVDLSQTDAAGGGGAGGSIIMVTTQTGATGLNNITASATGGGGGYMTTFRDHGPGGGGGGGIIISNGTFLSTNISGGINGLTRTGSTNLIDNPYGATPGTNGVVITLTAPPILVNSNNPGSPCGVLPVTLTHFSARLNNNTTELLWKIVNEFNLDRFDLEYSINGTTFSKLTSVSYQQDVSLYGYTHSKPTLKNFYRLKMIDLDGRFFYSKILSVQKNSATNKVVLIYPNPAYNDLTLRIFNDRIEKVIINIIDNSGRVVINKIFTLPSGQNYISIEEIDKLPPSVYIVKVISQSVNVVEKLIVGRK